MASSKQKHIEAKTGSNEEKDRWLKKNTANEKKQRCSQLCLKAYLAVFNIVFLLCGLATLAIGIWIKVDRDTFLVIQQLAQGSGSTPVVNSIPYVLIAIGATMVVICFIGGCGACTENICFLCLYAIIVALLILAQIVVVIIIVVRREDLVNEFSNAMLHQVRVKYNRTANPDVNKTDPLTNVWDSMQVQMKCCGALGPDDYVLSAWWNHTRPSMVMFVPHTCCELYNDNPQVPMVRDNNQCQNEAVIYPMWKENPSDVTRLVQLHTMGCVNAIFSWIKGQAHIIIPCLVCSIILQVLGLVTSCFLIARLKRIQGQSWQTEEDG